MDVVITNTASAAVNEAWAPQAWWRETQACKGFAPVRLQGSVR